MYAFCPNCKTTFETNFIDFSDSENVYIGKGNTFPCPYCRYTGAELLEGHFSFDAKGLATLLSGPEFTQDELSRFKRLVELARTGNYTREEFIQEAGGISKAAEGMASKLPKNMADWVTVLDFLLSLLAFLLNQNPTTQITNNINNTTVIHQHIHTTNVQADSTQNQYGKVGRNVLCPCGSGKKFKKCHG